MTTSVPGVGAVRTPRHLYYHNGRGPWPGVTTVTDVLDKPALVKWKREQVAIAALAHAERLVRDREDGNDDAAVAFLLSARNEGTNSRERGTRIHTAIEGILRRESPEIDPRDVAAVEGARAWLNAVRPIPLEVESFLIHATLGYGGTCDLIAELEGEVWLLDWKSSKSVAWPNGRVYSEHRLQLAAYANAEFIGRPGDEAEYELPAIARLGVVHVTDAGTRLYPADVNADGTRMTAEQLENDWIAFRACLRLHQWQSPRSWSAA
jgi:hypothetical protein